MRLWCRCWKLKKWCRVQSVKYALLPSRSPFGLTRACPEILFNHESPLCPIFAPKLPCLKINIAPFWIDQRRRIPNARVQVVLWQGLHRMPCGFCQCPRRFYSGSKIFIGKKAQKSSAMSIIFRESSPIALSRILACFSKKAVFDRIGVQRSKIDGSQPARGAKPIN